MDKEKKLTEDAAVKACHTEEETLEFIQGLRRRVQANTAELRKMNSELKAELGIKE